MTGRQKYSDIINTIPQKSQYPCVFLDPTVTSATASSMISASIADSNTLEGSDKNIPELSRRDLLTLEHSCNVSFLRRLEHSLSKLRYADYEDQLPKNASFAVFGSFLLYL